MAHIYGKAGQDNTARASARNQDLIQRFGIPLLSLLLLGAAGIYSFWHIHVVLASVFAVLFVGVTLKFDDIGQLFTRHVELDDARTQAQQELARTLAQLPDEYHVFHGLIFQRQYVDHVVLGPNGLFLISTKSQKGKITLAKESLRLDGKRFMHDMIQACWQQTQSLTRQLELHYVAGVQLTPVICFNRAEVEILRPIRGVHIAQADALVPLIMQHEDSISPERIIKLIDRMSALVSLQPADSLSPEEAFDAALDDVLAGQGPAAGEDAASGQAEDQVEAQVMAGPATTPHLGPVDVDPDAPVCGKCGYQPTIVEAAMFPHECPRCSALYASQTPEEPPAPPATTRTTWRPTVLQLVLVVLLTAGGAGLIAYHLGYILPGMQGAEKQTPLPPAGTLPTDAAQPAESAGAVPGGADHGNLTGDLAGHIPSDQASQNQTADSTANATTAEAQADADKAAAHNQTRQAGTSGQTDAGAAQPAEQPDTEQPDTESEKKSKPGKQFDKGTLTVSASRPITFWLIDQQTQKRLGPYQLGANTTKDFVIPKGSYHVLYVEDGRRRQTSMSFLSDSGYLDF